MTRRSLYLWAIIAVAASGAVLRVLATDSWKYVFLALWGLAMVCGVLFMFWILLFDRFLIPVRDGMREAERESRLRRGRCGTCGYDLRASPDACPECGTAARLDALLRRVPRHRHPHEPARHAERRHDGRHQ